MLIFLLALGSVPPATATVPCGPALSDSVNTTVGDTPCAMAEGDLDQDGNLDIVTANCTSLDLSVLYGRENGHFDPELRLPIGVRPGDVAVGDLDGDGIYDIAVNCSELSHLLVYWGEGNRTFSSPTVIATPQDPTRLRMVDLDGDRHQDLILLSSFVSGVDVIWGDGTRNPSANSDFELPRLPLFLQLSDLDGDGTIDIATTACSDSTLYVLLGNGPRSFTPPQAALVVPGLALCWFSLGDLNGDGRADVAAVVNSYDGKVVVGLGLGNGQFGLETVLSGDPLLEGVAVADLDGDGLGEIAVTSEASLRITMFRGGALDFAGALQAGPCPDVLHAADLNSDQAMDLVVMSACGAFVSAYLNKAAPGVVSVKYSPTKYRLHAGGELQGALLLPPPYDPRLDQDNVQLVSGQTVLGGASEVLPDTTTDMAQVRFDLSVLDPLGIGNHLLTVSGCDMFGIPFRASASIEIVHPFNPIWWASLPGELPVLVRVSDTVGGVKSIRIYNSSGRLIRTAQSSEVGQAGLIAWDGRGSKGEQVGSGVYVVVVQDAMSASACKVIVLR